MLITLLITCSLFGVLQTQQLRGAYTIVAPGTIRSNSDYHVSVSLDDFTQSCWFNISLQIFSEEFFEVVSTVEVKVEPRTTKLVKMQLPRLLPGQAKLIVEGYRGIITSEISDINIEEKHYTLYIQTDKGKYRAGEVMQFRLIFLDRLLRPAKVQAVIDVNIYDGQVNCIQKFSDVTLVQGVFKGNLSLSEHPVLGQWTIEVTVDGAVLKEQLFQVARYALPAFSVQIDTKRNVAVDDGMMLINVKAYYTFGQPVKGYLTVLVNSTYTKYRIPNVTLAYEFDGETAISLDFKKDLDISSNFLVTYGIKTSRYIVMAKVTEALTSQTNGASTDVIVHYQPYKVKVNAPPFFNVHDSVNITVSVTDLNGNPIRDTVTPIHITISYYSYNMEILMKVVDIRTFDYRFPPPIQQVVYLNDADAGVVHVALEIPDEQQFSTYEVKAEYLKSISDPVFLRRIPFGFLNMDVLTERAEVGKEITFKITSTDPIVYFVYEIISRGNIMHSHRINVPNNKTEYILSINATHSMAPKITLFVHRIKSGVINPCLKDVYIEGVFENSINITTGREVLPGALVSLNVTTDKDSYVGLLGIDEKLLIESDYQTALTEGEIYSDLHDYDSINLDRSIYPGREAGLITFSNARNREGIVIGHPSIELFDIPFKIASGRPDVFEPLSHLRKLFAESWMFEDFERTPVDGLQLCKTVPDTITSWAITGFSLNPTTGLSLTRNATKLKVFQPFFISMDLPSLVKEGEIVEIPVYVSNYMNEDLLTDVTIENNDGYIDLLDSPTAEPRIEPNQTHSKSISTDGKEKFLFLVRPRKSGRCNVTVKAISRLASDAVKKTLVVESDGVRYSFLKTTLVHLPEDRQVCNTEIMVDIPELAVSGSESVQLSVTGDIFGLLMKNLRNGVKVPFGNGENNIRYMVSNLLVLKYLKTFNHSNPSLENKATLYLQLGYQNQLSFMQLDGSFALLDRTVKRTGDIWLSAYTMWALQQAKQFIKLDQKVIGKGLEYLKRKQGASGEYHSGKDVDEDVALTALVVISLLVDEGQILYKDTIAKGLVYLYAALDDINQPESIAIAMYALVLGNHERSVELLAKISSNAALNSQQLQWTGADTIESNLEATAYSFMGLLQSQKASLQTLYPILRSLASMGSGKRTPAHMLALEAMIKLAHQIDVGKNDVNIHFEGDQGESGEIQVNSSNLQALQKYELKSSSRRIKLRTNGKGFALVSVNYKYNTVPENNSSSIYQTNVTIKESTDWALLFEVCTAVKASLHHINLTAMEINLQSGYTAYEGSFDRIKENNELVKSIEMNKTGQSVKVYLEKVSQSGTCIQIGGSKTVDIYNLKPISIVVYDAENESQHYVFYHKGDLRKEGKEL